MPELPEVQTVVDDLVRAGLVGRTITGSRVGWPRSLAGTPPDVFDRRVRGRRLTSLSRRAKWIRCDLDGGPALLVHLRMTGRLLLAAAGAPVGRHEHVRLLLDDGRELRLHDPRKFGRVQWVADPAAALDRLGPEPLDRRFTARLLAARLSRRRRALKPLLLEQTFLAGLGNIYVDEALWAARLHPLRRADGLEAGEVRALHRAIRGVLRRALADGGTTLGRGQTTFHATTRGAGTHRRALKVFRRTGHGCPRCATPIERLVVGQRATHVCPRCQVEVGP